MKLREITTPVTSIPGIGQTTARTLAKLNIFTVADLLQHYPRELEDRTKIVPLAKFAEAHKVHTVAKVLNHSWFGFGRMRTLKITIDDDTAVASLICFNRPFLEKSLPVGSIISVTAPFSVRYGELQSSSFDADCIADEGNVEDFAGKTLPDSRLLPIYSLTAGITQFQMRKIVDKAIRSFSKGISDEIPSQLIEKYNLFSKQQAVISMHNPDNIEQAETARKSIIFEELFLFQTAIIDRYYKRNGHLPSTDDIQLSTVASSIRTSPDDTQNSASHSSPSPNEMLSTVEFAQRLSPRQKQLFSRLPFALTPDQMKVILAINDDIDRSATSSTNMARLLQGDVGSGKTLVAFFACLRQIDYGGQCAILAPTELLARQHADNAAAMLEIAGNLHLAFLTGNVKSENRTSLLSALKSGDIDIVIGTHALFSQSVVYKNLKLVIIDEQHRFGVLQRNAIIEKGRHSIESTDVDPNLLMMSATPIPRTLALTVFGDLDISNIFTMPNGRLPIQTHLTRQGNECRAYEAVRSELLKGHQAYFVYPLIESSEDSENEYEQNQRASSSKTPPMLPGIKNSLKSAEEMYTYLSEKVYPQFKVALVHSQIDENEQHRILTEFKNGSIDIIVATSVVEVGVDVPNATCMVIEHAERFGLAALHQLRGRVGRGKNQSHCFLIYSNKLTDIAKERLKALFDSTDGFYIAEKDMLLRGPGETAGIQQSGYFTLGIADPIRDRELLLITRAEAINNYAT